MSGVPESVPEEMVTTSLSDILHIQGEVLCPLSAVAVVLEETACQESDAVTQTADHIVNPPLGEQPQVFMNRLKNFHHTHTGTKRQRFL